MPLRTADLAIVHPLEGTHRVKGMAVWAHGAFASQSDCQLCAHILVGGKVNNKIENIADAIVTVVQDIACVETICVFIESARGRTGAYA